MDGILLIDKPSGMTSHDVVDDIRKRFGFKKVGHAGTLDPFATGLLVLLIGKATKLANCFINDDKIYRATVVLGVETTTGDIDGDMVSKHDCNVEKKEILEAIKYFTGCIEQIPPMFSAKKHKGKKLYEYARKGIEIKRNPVKITIKYIKLLNMDKNKLSLEIYCSKGTYIRQLATDLGRKVGVGAHVSELRRIKSGNFEISKALKLDKVCSSDINFAYENLL